ncbi:hypothetical protein JMJ77_0002287 [Colletotrichum scovillei]|uniref:Uncharacterized protein n=1 Tax=Colletotrichum scovillei TaxID=1209932 RepID=A0A9P7R7L2_9PEZI|nr:hypothetical protein JMJ77_0002287 [Colletotrichum scovillei]KAG7070707.1 hypothetical protein JMJ76_0001953 [Colletotrichum scovillei]KAG7078981.1 hypothetical protein JMJ78_0002643 [Colletotrichum scovillei]
MGKLTPHNETNSPIAGVFTSLSACYRVTCRKRSRVLNGFACKGYPGTRPLRPPGARSRPN